MKYKFDLKQAICCILIVIFSLAFCLTAYAAPDDDLPTDEPYAPVTTEYVEPETVPTQPEPETEPPVVTTEPYQPTEQYTEPVTEQQTQQEYTQAVGNIETTPKTTDDVQVPTLAKTISDKKYTTNQTYGMISWICVIIGLIVVFVVMVSTKVSGGKNNGRQRYDGGNVMNTAKRAVNEEYYSRR